MKLVFEPLVTTLLTSFLLFLIACFLFLNSKRILTIGYHTLTIVCVLSIARLLFPFEFSFTKNIYLNEMCCYIAAFFRKKHMLFPNSDMLPPPGIRYRFSMMFLSCHLLQIKIFYTYTISIIGYLSGFLFDCL